MLLTFRSRARNSTAHTALRVPCSIKTNTSCSRPCASSSRGTLLRSTISLFTGPIAEFNASISTARRPARILEIGTGYQSWRRVHLCLDRRGQVLRASISTWIQTLFAAPQYQSLILPASTWLDTDKLTTRYRQCHERLRMAQVEFAQHDRIEYLHPRILRHSPPLRIARLCVFACELLAPRRARDRPFRLFIECYEEAVSLRTRSIYAITRTFPNRLNS